MPNLVYASYVACHEFLIRLEFIDAWTGAMLSLGTLDAELLQQGLLRRRSCQHPFWRLGSDGRESSVGTNLLVVLWRIRLKG